MSRLKLYWVTTPGQIDDGFVVSTQRKAAARFVSSEQFAPPDWAKATLIAALPADWQDDCEEPWGTGWVGPKVIAAMGVETLHAEEPRVFRVGGIGGAVLTEGTFDYDRNKRQALTDTHTGVQSTPIRQ